MPAADSSHNQPMNSGNIRASFKVEPTGSKAISWESISLGNDDLVTYHPEQDLKISTPRRPIEGDLKIQVDCNAYKSVMSSHSNFLLSNMSASATPFQVKLYESSLHVPQEVFDVMRYNQSSANCTLPQLVKSRTLESQGHAPPKKQTWVVCTSRGDAQRLIVEFVIALTEGAIDSYPAFFYTSFPPHRLMPDFVRPRMAAMVQALYSVVLIRRVYAIFGPDILARLFAACWSDLTGIENYSSQPYYAAKLTVCTRQTFKTRPLPLADDLIADIRPAQANDIMGVAQCCHGFASDSYPYVLTQQGAIREAEILVSQGQVWIHRIIRKATGESDIASIVAFTRNSDNNATITKVYTNPHWRKRGCAERLVRQVCEFLLQTRGTVSLFVAHDNPAAALVYHRCGFVGLTPAEGLVPGVEHWTEIGFDREVVALGHW